MFTKTVRRQLGHVKRMAQGRPITMPSLGSMTLDEDDVFIAKKWLREKGQVEWFSGTTVANYETSFAQWNGSKYAFAFMGGRVALSACIHALGLQSGDEVIVPGYTCVVVPNAFEYVGVKVVYCDIELETYGADVASLRGKLTERTKAIVIQHLFGLVCRDYEAVLALAEEKGIAVIEDCAHSTGASYQGENVGNRGTVAFYSSEQSKIFNTIQGGIAVTNDAQIAAALQTYQQLAPWPREEFIDKLLYSVLLNYECFKHPQRWWRADFALWRYGHKRLISTSQEEMVGKRPADYGARMADPVAALGLNQLSKIDRYNQCRRESAAQWDMWCEAHGYQRPLVLEQSEPVYLRYPVLVEPEKKADLRWAEKELGVKLGVWFKTHAHPAQREMPSLPHADAAVAQCINLPTL